MKISSHVDWLTFNAPNPIITSKVIAEQAAKGNYKSELILENGERIHFGHKHTKQYHHIWTGQVLDYHSKEKRDEDIVGILLTESATFSRVDIAVDVLRDEDREDKDFISMKDFWDNLQLCVSNLKKYGKVEGRISPENHETTYIGDRDTRAKKGIFRAYDKGIQSGIGDNFLSRFELELKRDKANLAANYIADGEDLRAIMTKYIDFPEWDTWRRAMAAPQLLERYRGKAVEKDMTNYAWLVNQVAPAYGRALAHNLSEYGGVELHATVMSIAMRHFRSECKKLNITLL